MKEKLLLILFGKFKKNRDKEYKQTWYYMPWWSKYPKYRTFLQWLCSVFEGHEISKTECGSSGDGYLDYHCRWCDFLIKIPQSEMDIPSEMKDIIDELSPGK